MASQTPARPPASARSGGRPTPPAGETLATVLGLALLWLVPVIGALLALLLG